jgi:hypothetical protein
MGTNALRLPSSDFTDNSVYSQIYCVIITKKEFAVENALLAVKPAEPSEGSKQLHVVQSPTKRVRARNATC